MESSSSSSTDSDYSDEPGSVPSIPPPNPPRKAPLRKPPSIPEAQPERPSRPQMELPSRKNPTKRSVISFRRTKKWRASNSQLHAQIQVKQKKGERIILQIVADRPHLIDDGLQFSKGDELEYLGCGADGRFRVVHLDTTLEGEVLESDVILVDDSLWNYAWYHGRISKGSAFTLLKFASKGTYLVRRSTDGTSFTLQVKGSTNIFNWRISEDPRSAMFSIDDSKRFHTIGEMIRHYSEPRAKLEDANTNLRAAAVRDKPQLRDESAWEIKR